MRFTRVADWLRWQAQLHPRAIDPGLERVRAVAAELDLLTPEATVVSVAGTNGKGSTVAILEALARAAGRRPGAYTSPHLLAYNERIRLDGGDVDDDRLLRAFDAVDRARGRVSLTYFEFGTLAALWAFREAGADPWLLEVGLGGRLDAVNVLAADVAVITSIDIDHADWLGGDRDAIGAEKAGILRAGRPAVCGDPRPPASVTAHAAAIGADLRLAGRDFQGADTASGWCWQGGGCRLDGLPRPGFAGGRIDNAATALAAWHAGAPALPPLDAGTVATALGAARLAGRLDRLGPDWLVDVAHNPAAAARLAESLPAAADGRPMEAVFAVMRRKDLDGVVAALAPAVTRWHLLVLPDEDAWPVASLRAAVAHAGGTVGEVGAAAAVLPRLAARDAVKIACGSFRVAELVTGWYTAAKRGRRAV